MTVNLSDFPHCECIGRRKDENSDIEFYRVPDSVRVPAYDPATSSLVYVPVFSWSIHRGKEAEIVKLDNGKQYITDDDPRAVVGIAKDADALAMKRYTPTEALRNEVFVGTVWTDGSPRYFVDMDANAIVSYESKNNVEKQEVQESIDFFFDPETGMINEAGVGIKLDFEFGQFVGCIAGDGWFSRTNAISLVDNEGANAAFCTKFINTYFTHIDGSEIAPLVQKADSTMVGRYGATVKYTWFSKQMSPLIKQLKELVQGHKDERTAGSANKKLPLWSPAAPVEFRWGLIAGLLAADGSLSIHTHKPKKGERKGREQLLAAISSTSLRLLQNTQEVLRTLGVQSRLSFSKETTRGNASWMLAISTPDLKRNQMMLAKMCSTRKLRVLLDTPVNLDSSTNNSVQRHVVIPKCVSEVVKVWLHSPKCKAEWKTTNPERYAAVRDQSTFAVGLYQSFKAGVMTEQSAVRLVNYALQTRFNYEAGLGCILYTLEEIESNCETFVSDRTKKTYYRVAKEQIATMVAMLSRAICASARAYHDSLKNLFDTIQAKLRTFAARNTAEATTIADLKVLLQASMDAKYGMWYEPEFQDWLAIVCGGISWSKVISVEKTGQKEDGYDLTVPGYETFVSADGVVLSNTVNVHVPSSDAAVKECYEKLMPSTTPFSNREADKIVPLPKQEQILGLYTAATSPASDPYVFDTEDDAVDAIRRGQIPLSADVEIRKPKS